MISRLCITLVGLCALGVSVPAHAAFVARICNDIQCMGGDDTIVQDNSALDTVPMLGVVSFVATAASAFGYTVLVNTSQSKPVIGSATLPQLDLSFVVTSGAAGGNNIFLYASDTNFTGSPFFSLAVGGTNSGASGTVTSRAWGGTSNTEFQFSAANLLGILGPLTGMMYSAATLGSFAATANPFSLTIGTQVSRATAGTSTGDLNLQISVVPEPGTWMMMSAGLLLMGFVATRRARKH